MQFNAAATRLSVVLEADPSALVRVLHFFQSRNVVPLSVVARRECADTIEVEVDVAVSDLDAVAMNIIPAKVAALPSAFSGAAPNRPLISEESWPGSTPINTIGQSNSNAQKHLVNAAHACFLR
jgi:hypothetical protein